MDWIVYILKCGDGTLYTGITNDLEHRLLQHAQGTGAKYTRGRGPHDLVYTEMHPTRSDALKRELQIKALNVSQKRALFSAADSA